ncbi:hypothetical protein KPSA1_03362 [Pseudomonas syringae pv. actinidiae]|uniref:Uncharacterized protein n=1 Tax=Pseudomonas syringae pv. actinidiae TaxID=103796 RepID=A0A2V0QH86_PSESF|nr:hypothetical protein KPSA1_03362 [Pseudomonas syringae pv. actinidiae]
MQKTAKLAIEFIMNFKFRLMIHGSLPVIVIQRTQGKASSIKPLSAQRRAKLFRSTPELTELSDKWFCGALE